jgi:hypothetical protein
MVLVCTPADQILQAIANVSECSLEEVARSCPNLTWNEVYLEVDRLIRTGQVRLILKGPGLYFASLASRRKGILPMTPVLESHS